MSECNVKTIILNVEPELNLLIIQMFSELSIKISNIEDLDNMQLSRDIFLDTELHKNLINYVPYLKKYLKSSMLTSLHDNSIIKQKFPSINIFRQILKCQGYKMTPFIVSNGYQKNNGKKVIKRFFSINRIVDH
jgi:hypothetical protein